MGLLFVGGFALGTSGCVAPEPLTPRAPTPGAVHFRVETFNIHRHRSGDASTVEAVGAANVEIVCIQEVTVEWERVLRERYALQYEHMVFAPAESAGGLGVLSRYPIHDRGVIPVPGLHPAWLVEVDTPSGPIQVLNVHLRSLFEGRSNPIASYLKSDGDHVSEIKHFSTRLAPDLPTIVAGDFNEGPNGDAVQVLESRGFTNALPLFRPGQFTWKGTSVAKMVEMSIDHVMFDRAFVPLDARIGDRGGSDHFPVIAHLEMREPSTSVLVGDTEAE